MKVSIIMGSKSDWDVMSAACETLESFGVEYEKKVISAHRTPQFFMEYMAGARDRGVGIVIAGAGGAAHLPGMAAALTTLPVIGIPINSSLNGLDALLATVQMPSGIPVATVAVDGAKNAAWLAAEILAVEDANLAQKIADSRAKNAADILAKDKEINK